MWSRASNSAHHVFVEYERQGCPAGATLESVLSASLDNNPERGLGMRSSLQLIASLRLIACLPHVLRLEAKLNSVVPADWALPAHVAHTLCALGVREPDPDRWADLLVSPPGSVPIHQKAAALAFLGLRGAPRNVPSILSILPTTTEDEAIIEYVFYALAGIGILHASPFSSMALPSERTDVTAHLCLLISTENPFARPPGVEARDGEFPFDLEYQAILSAALRDESKDVRALALLALPRIACVNRQTLHLAKESLSGAIREEHRSPLEALELRIALADIERRLNPQATRATLPPHQATHRIHQSKMPTLKSIFDWFRR